MRELCLSVRIDDSHTYGAIMPVGERVREAREYMPERIESEVIPGFLTPLTLYDSNIVIVIEMRKI